MPRARSRLKSHVQHWLVSVHAEREDIAQQAWETYMQAQAYLSHWLCHDQYGYLTPCRPWRGHNVYMGHTIRVNMLKLMVGTLSQQETTHHWAPTPPLVSNVSTKALNGAIHVTKSLMIVAYNIRNV